MSKLIKFFLDKIWDNKIVLIIISALLFVRAATLMRGYLGYDMGIYKKYFEIHPGFFQTPNSELLLREPPGLYFVTKILTGLGVSSEMLVTWAHSLLAAAILVLIYLTARELFDKKSAIFASFLYFVSLIQFETFYFVYFKMEFAILLTLVAFLFFLKKKPIASIITSALLGISYPPIFVLLMLLFVIYMLLGKTTDNRKKILYIILLSITATGILYLINPVFLQTFYKSLGLGNKSIFLGSDGGSFYSLWQYILFSPYVFLAILAAKDVWKNKRTKPLIIYLLLLVVMIILRVYGYNRLITFLDIFIIVIAAKGLIIFVDTLRKFLVGKIIIFTLITFMFFFMIYNIATRKPEVEPGIINSIKSISRETENNAKILIFEKRYAPWVYGYSSREVVAPGIFVTNSNDEILWNNIKDNRPINCSLVDPHYIMVFDSTNILSGTNKHCLKRINNHLYKIE